MSKDMRLIGLLVCLCWSGVSFAAQVNANSMRAGTAAQAPNAYGEVQGFSGPFAVSNWTIGSNGPPPSLVDTSHAPGYVVLKNYAGWAVSGAAMEIEVATPGTVSFHYTYSGPNPSECPFVFAIGSDRTTLSASSGYPSFYVAAPHTKITFALNGKDEPGNFGCANPTGAQTTLTISQFSYLPPVLIHPFGDSITYGLGALAGSGVSYPYNACPLYQTEQVWCTQPPMEPGAASPPPNAVPGGYRGWMTEFAIRYHLLSFRTEGYQNGYSSTAQWYTSTQAHDGYPGYCTTGTPDPASFCSQYNLAGYSMQPSFADITLVHAGTNDIIQGKSAADTMTGLNTLIRNLLTYNDHTQLFVAKIIKFYPPVGNLEQLNAAVDAYNSQIQSSYGAGQNPRVTVVDMQGALNGPGYYSDGIHPNSQGYQRMACTWIRAIKGMAANPQEPCAGMVP